MTVTNNIRDEVNFIDNEWCETPLTNEQILDLLAKQKEAGFLSYSWRNIRHSVTQELIF